MLPKHNHIKDVTFKPEELYFLSAYVNNCCVSKFRASAKGSRIFPEMPRSLALSKNCWVMVIGGDDIVNTASRFNKSVLFSKAKSAG